MLKLVRLEARVPRSSVRDSNGRAHPEAVAIVSISRNEQLLFYAIDCKEKSVWERVQLVIIDKSFTKPITNCRIKNMPFLFFY